MAILFMMAAECGADEASARRILEHFRQVRWNLSDGSPMYFDCRDDDVWHRREVVWCSAMPSGVSATGSGQRITHNHLRVEVIKRIYEELRLLTGFRYALAGWEAASEGEYADIVRQLESGESSPGLVVSEEIWIECGRPEGYERFGQGTRWKSLGESEFFEMVRW